MGAVKHIEYIQGIENQALGSAKDAFPIQFHLFSVFSYLFFLNRKLLSLSHAMSILKIGPFFVALSFVHQLSILSSSVSLCISLEQYALSNQIRVVAFMCTYHIWHKVHFFQKIKLYKMYFLLKICFILMINLSHTLHNPPDITLHYPFSWFVVSDR